MSTQHVHSAGPIRFESDIASLLIHPSKVI